MEIRAFPGGPLKTMTYVVWDPESKDAIVVDASQGADVDVPPFVQEEKLKVHCIVTTHGHWDHIPANTALQEKLGAPLLVHTQDKARLAEPFRDYKTLPIEVPPSIPDRLLEDQEIVEAGTLSFKVLHTPGHTPGSICLYFENEKIVFTGDTLFAGTYGRTDLTDGDHVHMHQSLERLAQLPHETRVYPGHGWSTIIGKEEWLLDRNYDAVI